MVEYLDIDASANRENIEMILNYLSRRCHKIDLPPIAIDAIQALLLRAERAEQRLAERGSRTRVDHGKQTLKVGGAYERGQPLVEVTYTCRICGVTRTRLQLPGAVPTICQPTSADKPPTDCQREANRQRVRASRERHKVIIATELASNIAMLTDQPTPITNRPLLDDSDRRPLPAIQPDYTINGYPASAYQSAILHEVEHGSGDILVIAAAGSGKSTTMVAGIDVAPVSRADVLPLAFNVHIAAELKRKLAGKRITASTIHSVGYNALRRYLGTVLPDNSRANGRKYSELARRWIEDALARRYPNKLPSENPNFYDLRDALKDCADFARLTLTNYNDLSALARMSARFGLTKPKEENWILSGVADLLTEGQRLARENGDYDFTDMIWLPFVWELPLPEMAFITVDEAQDLNALQREFVLRLRAAGGRILWVGDPDQSIMGFAGADVDSFYAIQSRTNAKMLPLSISYRCPMKHIELARAIVPTIEARPDAPIGIVETITEDSMIDLAGPQDMIICRRTAPLVSLALKFLAKRKPARVRGQDGFGKGLSSMVDRIVKSSRCTFTTFESGVKAFQHRETERLGKRDNTGSQITTLADKCQTLIAVYRDTTATTLDAFKREIEALFEDASAAIILSTVHRAKGLEANRVFIIEPETMPLEWPKQQDWEYEQELHIKYVALTRSKSDLFLVPKPDEKKAGTPKATPLVSNVTLAEPPALDEHERAILEIMTFSKPYGSRYTTRTDIYRQHKVQLAAMVERGLIEVAERKGSTVLYMPTDMGLATLRSGGQKR